MSYDSWKTTDPRDSEPDFEGHDITKDCDVRGFEHRWETRGRTTACVDCGKVSHVDEEEDVNDRS